MTYTVYFRLILCALYLASRSSIYLYHNWRKIKIIINIIIIIIDEKPEKAHPSNNFFLKMFKIPTVYNGMCLRNFCLAAKTRISYLFFRTPIYNNSATPITQNDDTLT